MKPSIQATDFGFTIKFPRFSWSARDNFKRTISLSLWA